MELDILACEFKKQSEIRTKKAIHEFFSFQEKEICELESAIESPSFATKIIKTATKLGILNKGSGIRKMIDSFLPSVEAESLDVPFQYKQFGKKYINNWPHEAQILKLLFENVDSWIIRCTEELNSHFFFKPSENTAGSFIEEVLECLKEENDPELCSLLRKSAFYFISMKQNIIFVKFALQKKHKLFSVYDFNILNFIENKVEYATKSIFKDHLLYSKLFMGFDPVPFKECLKRIPILYLNAIHVKDIIENSFFGYHSNKSLGIFHENYMVLRKKSADFFLWDLDKNFRVSFRLLRKYLLKGILLCQKVVQNDMLEANYKYISSREFKIEFIQFVKIYCIRLPTKHDIFNF